MPGIVIGAMEIVTNKQISVPALTMLICQTQKGIVEYMMSDNMSRSIHYRHPM